MSLISGIPPWVQMYFERLLEVSGKSSVGEVFPNLELFVTGGVAFEPYRARFEELFGRKVPIVQTYPASEGFIAYQDQPDSLDLLLLLNNGIYYEFVPADRFFDENPPRLSLEEVAGWRQLRAHHAHQRRALGLQHRRHRRVRVHLALPNPRYRPHQALYFGLRRARNRL